VKQYSSVKRWLSQVFADGIRSEKTEKLYLHFLRRFCEYAGKTPDQLIEERRLHLQSPDEFTRRQHERLLTDWRNHLETEGGLSKKKLARSSVVTAMNVVKSFYKANYVPLQVRSPKKWEATQRKTPTREEVRRMVEACSKARDRAVILVLFQSGVSLEDLGLITYGLIREEFEAGVEPLHIPIRRTKIMKRYDTFLGADSLEALREYFEEKPPNPRKPIFQLSPRMIQYLVKDASIRAGLKPHVTPHKLRSGSLLHASSRAAERDLQGLRVGDKHNPAAPGGENQNPNTGVWRG